jgi:hypothetical protein
MKKALTPLIALFIVALTGCASSTITHESGDTTLDSIVSKEGIVLKGNERLTTPGKFKAPVEIKIVAKTDSTNLRMAYAAKQVIFNWERDREQLRVDGGPAAGIHKAGAGRIPEDEYVTIRWIVTPTHQAIYVNDQLRYEHTGNYSKINTAVSVFPANGSVVTVKSIKVKQLSITP